MKAVKEIAIAFGMNGSLHLGLQQMLFSAVLDLRRILTPLTHKFGIGRRLP
jgi:hypothetical protein